MAIFNSLEFDGINSLDIGVYITGEAVYNAPERDVEIVEVPGRNGDILLDNGRFKNIEVKYPAGAFGDSQSEFSAKMRNFRNLMKSRKGYCRLVDTYNPDEYRLGVLKDVVEVDSVGRAGEFDLIFNCKPQRFLMSGEAAHNIASSGDTIYNPTFFDASPIIQVTGYGTLTVGSSTLELSDETFGEFELLAAGQTPVTRTGYPYYVSNKKYQAGDTLSGGACTAYITFNLFKGTSTDEITNAVVTGGDLIGAAADGSYFQIKVDIPAYDFTAGTAYDSANTTNFDISVSYTYNGASQTESIVGTASRIYISGNTQDIFLFERNHDSAALYVSAFYVNYSSIIAYSTKSILGTPTYFDCDLGIAYMIDDGAVVDLNRYIDLGSELPVLAPGSTTITFDNTITALDIVPRWWVI